MIYEFSPKQDLHGYDKPWAPGAGVNQWDEVAELGNINSSGQDSTGNGYWRTKNYIPIEPGKQYNIFAEGITNSKAIRGRFYESDKTFLGTTDGNGQSLTTGNIFTAPENAYFLRFSPDIAIIPIGTKMSINYPATVTTYSPYSNICQPEGYDIWDPSQEKMIQVYSGYVNANTRELYLRPVYQEYAGEELVGPWMSSMDEYSEDATPTEGAFVIDFGGELTSYEITPFMLQTLLDSMGIRQHFTNGAGLLNSLMDQAQGRVRSEEELLHLSRPLNVIAIGDQLPTGLTFKPISKDVLPGLPGKFIR